MQEKAQPQDAAPGCAMALRKRLRLKHPADFARLRQEGRVKRHPLFVLSVAPNALDHNRYGFITSKRLGNAVKRNRIRRQLSEAVRLTHHHLRPGYDVIIIARHPIMQAPFATIQTALHETLLRAQLLED
jgi:ribonuclease P protein component